MKATNLIAAAFALSLITGVASAHPGHGGAPGHGHDHGHGHHHHHRITCKVKNLRGNTFEATARSRAVAVNRAMDRCQRVSAVCVATSCSHH